MSRISIASNVSSVTFLDVNSSNCPGYTIETRDGRRVGIYAQEGTGFIFYDYSAQRRLGVCSFD